MATLEKKAPHKLNVSTFAPLFGLLFVLLLFILWTGGSIIRPSNLEVILNQAYNTILVGFGAIFVFAYGGLDFSFGALLGACAMLLAHLTRAGVPTALAVLVSMLVGMLSGLMIGAASGYLKIPVFIVTLSFEYIWRGIAEFGCSTSLIYAPSEFTSAFNRWSIKLPVLFLMGAVFLFLFNKTRIGKNLRAIGGNPLASRLSGVNVPRYIVLAHLFAGLCVGITAIFSLARATTAIATTGTGFEMDVLIGLVLGGMALGGGAGVKFPCIFIGAFTQAVLSNGLILVGMNQYLVEGITGGIFIVVVALSFKRRGHGRGFVIT